jgi:hypothetical protein
VSGQVIELDGEICAVTFASDVCVPGKTSGLTAATM